VEGVEVELGAAARFPRKHYLDRVMTVQSQLHLSGSMLMASENRVESAPVASRIPTLISFLDHARFFATIRRVQERHGR
jgi:hypothetical protein